MSSLQLNDHVVQNRQTGEQMTHWDIVNKATQFEFSMFNTSQCVICSPVWRFVPRDRSAAKGPLKSTSLILHKRALPLIYFSSNSEHAIPLLLPSNILRINMLHYKSVGVLMHNIIDHDLVPSKSEAIHCRIALSHSHNTRAAAAGNFHVIHSRTKQQDNPCQDLELESGTKSPKQSFKRHLKTKLLQFLVHDGVYVDVYNLADKLFLDKNLFFYDKFHLYSSSFLCIDLISFLSFVSNDLFLSLWINGLINFLADI